MAPTPVAGVARNASSPSQDRICPRTQCMQSVFSTNTMPRSLIDHFSKQHMEAPK